MQCISRKNRRGKELGEADVKPLADGVQRLDLHRTAALFLDGRQRRLRHSAPFRQRVFRHVPLNAELLDPQRNRIFQQHTTHLEYDFLSSSIDFAKFYLLLSVVYLLFDKISVIMSKRWNMIVTFCGHRDFQETGDVKGRLMSILATLADSNETLICYTGGYGSFDRFAARCVKEAQKTAENIRNCLVVPYLTVTMQKELKGQDGFFDEVHLPRARRRAAEVRHPSPQRVDGRAGRSRHRIHHAQLRRSREDLEIRKTERYPARQSVGRQIALTSPKETAVPTPKKFFPRNFPKCA